MLVIVFVFFLAALASFFRINDSFISNWDEAFYADGMRSMIRSHELIIPYWNSQPFLDKPPLHLWIGSIGRLLIGDTSFGYRFSSVSSVFITLILVYVYTKKKFGTLAGLVAVLCLACNEIFIWRGRGANTDAALTLLILIVFIVSQRKTKWKYYWLGFLLSLVYLTKSTVVLFPILSLGLLELQELFQQRSNIDWRSKLTQWLQGLLCLIALPSIWLFLGYLKQDFRFISFYLWQSDYQASAIAAISINFLYIKTLTISLGFFSILVLIGLGAALKKYQHTQALALLTFTMPLLLALSFSPVRYHWYLMPALPIFGILAGYAVYELRKWRPSLTTLPLLLVIAGASLLQFNSKIMPLFYDNSGYHQATSGIWLSKHTSPDDVIVRLDEVYPTLIFYSDRRVLISSPTSPSVSYFISRADLLLGINQGKFKWLSGKNVDIEVVAAQLLPNHSVTHAITSDEAVLEVIQR